MRPRLSLLRAARLAATAFVTLWIGMSTAQASGPGSQSGYYRMPAIHGDTIVFCSEGDLWRAPVTGGPATRLTTHAGDETFPAISPDGTQVAFIATYEGPSDLYVMPLAGGLPKRLTFSGRAQMASGWTKEGRILLSTTEYCTLPNTQTVAIDPATGDRELLALAQCADGVFTDDGASFFFTRLWPQSSRTKRYRGGSAQNIWRYTDGQPEAVPLTADWTGTSRRPMWWNGRVYFESDRDGTMNLWSMNPDGGDLKPLTKHAGWDTRTPSQQGGRIVYQLGADIHLYDIAAGQDRLVDITLPSDFDQTREKWIDKPIDYLTAWHLSPDGDRMVLTSRGQIFSAPTGRSGRLIDVTRSDGHRYRSARFVDGKGLAALSDRSGEVEWWTLPADGLSKPAPVTKAGHTLRFDGVPSPDGKWLASWDQDQELRLVDRATGAERKVAFSANWEFDPPVWSSDSRWFVYGMTADNLFMQLFLYDVIGDRSVPLTTDRYNSRAPAWSADGQWLYFLSDRNLNSVVPSVWGTRQPEPYFDKQDRIYAVPLTPGARFPFQPADELTPKEKKSDEKKGDGKTGDAKPAGKPAIAIDVNGIEQRLLMVPAPAGNYASLAAGDKALYLMQRSMATTGSWSLMALELKDVDAKLTELAGDIGSFELSADRKKIGLRKGDNLYCFDAGTSAPKLEDSKVDLSNWAFRLDPRAEWSQHFEDAWRLERDFFWDPAMSGVDWKKMREKYRPLVQRVRARAELSDIQTMLASELSTLHMYVYGGDLRKGDEDIQAAFLGAPLMRDAARGGWRVARVYRTDPDIPDELSPLARYGVNIRAGDVITAINGAPTLDEVDPLALLRRQAGKPVRLTVRPTGVDTTRDVIVQPIGAEREFDLRYDDWEFRRREMVDSLGQGEIGYVHIRAMGSGNITEWFREFYPVFDRAGLIIDVRNNRGGNIESWFLARLLRQAWMYWQPRVGRPYWNMQYAFRGHMAVLSNERNASDGEIFAEGFKRLKLGPCIGTRSWGGEIWLSSNNFQADEGIMTAAETGVYGNDGTWLVEGHGVDPDIVVDNLPHATFLGRDAQLEAAVAYLKAQIARDPRAVPPAPPRPDKSSPDNRR